MGRLAIPNGAQATVKKDNQSHVDIFPAYRPHD